MRDGYPCGNDICGKISVTGGATYSNRDNGKTGCWYGYADIACANTVRCSLAREDSLYDRDRPNEQVHNLYPNIEKGFRYVIGPNDFKCAEPISDIHVFIALWGLSYLWDVHFEGESKEYESWGGKYEVEIKAGILGGVERSHKISDEQPESPLGGVIWYNGDNYIVEVVIDASLNVSIVHESIDADLDLRSEMNERINRIRNN